jgi:hypothetical protein
LAAGGERVTRRTPQAVGPRKTDVWESVGSHFWACGPCKHPRHDTPLGRGKPCAPFLSPVLLVCHGTGVAIGRHRNETPSRGGERPRVSWARGAKNGPSRVRHFWRLAVGAWSPSESENGTHPFRHWAATRHAHAAPPHTVHHARCLPGRGGEGLTLRAPVLARMRTERVRANKR